MAVENLGRNPKAVRFLRDRSRITPRGLEFVESWMAAHFSPCFQLERYNGPNLCQELYRRFVRPRRVQGRAVSHGPKTAVALAEQL